MVINAVKEITLLVVEVSEVALSYMICDLQHFKANPKQT
jgi:hypothetical protein